MYKNALELSYKLYGDLSLNRSLTQKEKQLEAINHWAGYSGALKTGLFLNTLYFFPDADSTNQRVGKYVKTMEYNPE